MTEEKKITKPAKSKKYIITVGRRKEAVARVYLREGSGKFRIGKRTLEQYFPRESHRLIIGQPLKKAGLTDKIDIMAKLNGGGISGQADALKHGISRGIVKFDESKKDIIKKAGFLTRDPRAKERKKYGRKRARKKFQYSKR